jgi:hypothetical protein
MKRTENGQLFAKETFGAQLQKYRKGAWLLGLQAF